MWRCLLWNRDVCKKIMQTSNQINIYIHFSFGFYHLKYYKSHWVYVVWYLCVIRTRITKAHIYLLFIFFFKYITFWELYNFINVHTHIINHIIQSYNILQFIKNVHLLIYMHTLHLSCIIFFFLIHLVILVFFLIYNMH